MTFDAAQFKRLERTGYNRLGRRYLAASARRAMLAEGLLAAADLGPGLTVLDLASGPGLLLQPPRHWGQPDLSSPAISPKPSSPAAHQTPTWPASPQTANICLSPPQVLIA